MCVCVCASPDHQWNDCDQLSSRHQNENNEALLSISLSLSLSLSLSFSTSQLSCLLFLPCSPFSPSPSLYHLFSHYVFGVCVCSLSMCTLASRCVWERECWTLIIAFCFAVAQQSTRRARVGHQVGKLVGQSFLAILHPLFSSTHRPTSHVTHIHMEANHITTRSFPVRCLSC